MTLSAFGYIWKAPFGILEVDKTSLSVFQDVCRMELKKLVGLVNTHRELSLADSR